MRGWEVRSDGGRILVEMGMGMILGTKTGCMGMVYECDE